MGYKELWQAVLGELEVTLSRANFATWFKNTSIIQNEDGHVIVAVPNIFTKEWLEKKYHGDIKNALAKISGHIESIEYKVASTGGTATIERQAEKSSKEVPAQASAKLAHTAAAIPATSTLNPRYTFDNFVVGSSNELAHAACQAVAEYPGEKYNPLFIYGGPGLGKTHLIEAIGNQVHATAPDKKVVYITCEEFTNEFVSSLSRKQTGSFKEKYRGVDVLIVDDMQFLGGKEKTQEEFFHIFNALHQSNKQIVLSSDKPPKSIAALEERLRSRFEWGMTADIQAPDYETRAAILRAKAVAQGIQLPGEVVEYIAGHISRNIRELEGALTQLLAHCELRGIEPNIAVAKGVLGGLAAKSQLKTVTAKSILDKTAAYFDLSMADLVGPKRDKEIVVPRQIAMYLMRQEISLSFPKIAAAVGGRDHTTALHSVTKIEKLVESDENLRTDIQALKEQLVK